MNWLQSLFGLIFSPIAKLISSLSGRGDPRHEIGPSHELYPIDEDCCYCSKCVAGRRKRFAEKCALVENYINDNLALYEQLEQILQLQTINIKTQLTLLNNLNSSSEHLKAAISDCLEKHVSFVNQFTQGMERLQINQKIEESLAFARSEENIEDFKRKLIWSIVNKEKRSIKELLE